METHGQHGTQELLIVAVSLNATESSLGAMIKKDKKGKWTWKSTWMKENWELWFVPMMFMVCLSFIQTVHIHYHATQEIECRDK